MASLKLLSYNIRFGGVGREEQLAAVIRAIDPDIVVFQEASVPRVIRQLAEETELGVWAANPGYSIGFISRVDVARHAWHHPAGSKHAFLELSPVGSSLRIYGLHLSSQFSNWSERQRDREIRALLRGIEAQRKDFHVLVGDFNTLAPGEVLESSRMPAWIRALIWLSGRDIRRHTIQTMLDEGYVDGFRRLHPIDRGYSFPTWDPHVRLDYLFVPEDHADKVQAIEVVKEVDGVAQASDHYPLLIQLEIV